MATLYTHKDANIRKTWYLLIGFFVAVIALGWGFSFYFDNQIILYVSVAIAIIMNVGSYWFSDSLVVSMTGAQPADEKAYPDLHNIVENLAITAGLPKPKVYIVEDPVPNAFATGRSPEHSLVAFTTGLLAILDRAELEGVAAHELSHIGNRDMLVSTVAVVLVGFVAILSDMFMRMSMFGGDRERDGKAGLIILVIGIVGAILAPLAAQLLQLAISRKREFLADASGALLTRYPEGLASALKKIHAYGRGHQMTRASHATAHLFIANPFGDTEGEQEEGEPKRSWFASLFMTHPPVQDRVDALLNKR